MGDYESEFVYHYTDISGLTGILRAHCLLASHYLFLNDPLELQLGRSSVLDIFRREIAAFGQMDPSDDFQKALHGFQQWVEGYLTQDQEVYLASFSYPTDKLEEQHGSRTLWERYSALGGYALEFAREELEHCVFLEENKFGIRNIDLVKVAYSVPNFTAEDSQLIAQCVSWLARKIGHYDSIANLLDMLMRHLTTTKNWYHRDENEVRIVIIPSEPGEEVYKPDRLYFRADDFVKNPKSPSFLPKQGAVSPRYPLFGQDTLGPEFHLPVTRVIVGPHTNQDGRVAGVRRFLDSVGLNLVLAEPSEIEIRTQF